MTYVADPQQPAPAPRPARPARRALSTTAKILIAVGAAIVIAVIFFFGGFAAGHAVGAHQHQRGVDQGQQFNRQFGNQNGPGAQRFGNRNGLNNQGGTGLNQNSQAQQPTAPGGTGAQQGGVDSQLTVPPSTAPSALPQAG